MDQPAAKPCRTCPLRVGVPLTPQREAELVASAAVAGDPLRCPNGRLCAPWLVVVGPGNRWVQEAVAGRTLPLDALESRSWWPPVHPSVDAVLDATTDRESAGRVDPVMAELRARRIALGISQTRAARLANITRWTLSSDEGGRSNPPLTRLRAYAAVYGVDLAVIPAQE